MSVRAVLLSEDAQMACFGRRFLKTMGYSPREIREATAPRSRGSGEQWVREHLPAELRAMRATRHSALIVMTDADTITVGKRISTLRRKCEKENVPWRHAEEPLLLIIPGRNIETWFAYLRGEIVNETDNFPRHRHEADCREEVRTLADFCKSNKLRAPAPASLVKACGEWRLLR